MHGELLIGPATLVAFLLVLTRVAGAFVFVPIPGAQSALPLARIVLVIAITLALFSRWPGVEGPFPEPGRIMLLMAEEAAVGMAIGLVVSFATEAFLVSFQMIGLQAGYTFASTVDPTTMADSNLMQVLGQIAAGLLFFGLNLDHQVLRAFAQSLAASPPGKFAIAGGEAEAVVRLAAGIFATGLRLALPVVAMLILLDLALALMARVNAHLQLLTVAFPLKILAALMLLSCLAYLLPRVYGEFAGRALAVVARFAGV